MRYSIRSHGIIIGYTELDIACVSPNLREGFVEPTEAGRQALLDATGVHAVCAERPATWRDRDDADSEEYMKEFRRACDRREGLDLELRDDRGELFPCAFMRIYDMHLKWPEPASEPDDVDPREDDDVDPELRAQMEHDAQMVREWFEELEKEWETDAWKRSDEPSDPRWETMQYHIQVHLHELTLEELQRELESQDDEPWTP